MTVSPATLVAPREFEHYDLRYRVAAQRVCRRLRQDVDTASETLDTPAQPA